jgi:hypothetical protein
VRWQDTNGDGGAYEGAELYEAAADVLPANPHPDHGFVSAVATASAAYPDVAIALRAHVVADAIYRSAGAKGQAVACG